MEQVLLVALLIAILIGLAMSYSVGGLELLAICLLVTLPFIALALFS